LENPITQGLRGFFMGFVEAEADESMGKFAGIKRMLYGKEALEEGSSYFGYDLLCGKSDEISIEMMGLELLGQDGYLGFKTISRLRGGSDQINRASGERFTIEI